MSFFTQLTEVVQIDDDNSVTLKMPSVEDRIKIMEPIAHLIEENEMLFGLRAQMAACITLVLSWHGPGFEERGVTPENIKALPPVVFDKIANHAVQLVGMTEEKDDTEKK